ncbi:MAG: sensor histidine kinase [Alphaproteobacteria bacterium]|nr:sensor histidine kinase [Alphaproteobacteria bacterium]
MTFFLVLERLPLPDSVAPLETMVFQQEAAGDAAQAVSLPDNWRSFPERPVESGVYRQQFDAPDGSTRWAVYIPNYSGQLLITVNDAELVTGGFLSGELIADQSVPFFAPIPRNVLKSGVNGIDIELVPGGKLVGFLSNVYVGPADQLRSSFEWHFLRAVRLPVLVVFWQLLLALLLFVLWYSRRNEQAALYGAILLVFSSAHGIPVYMPSSIAMSNTVALLGYVVNFWLSVLGLLFTASLANRPLPLRTRYFLLLPALASVAYIVLPKPIFDLVDTFIVVPFSLLMSGWVVYLLVHSALWQRQWDSLILLISVLGACAVAIHDTLIIANVLPNSNFLHFRIVYILLLPAMSIIFFRRLIASMNHVDDLVSTLEERIEQKEAQLRETYAQRQLLEGRQALNDERQRIMRDVHDGLGGQLMSIIAMATNRESRPEAIEGSARAALEDLRTMIHSLGVEDDITGILGTFRERAEQQLALQGIALNWQMVEIPPIEGLTPSAALNLLRVLQEATTNASRHSGAKNVTIGFSLVGSDGDFLRIDIDDDGCGFEQATTTGLGLKNMANRAKALSGTLEIASSSNGTRVCLTIPTRYGPSL